MAIATLDQLIAGMQAPRDFMKVVAVVEAAGVLHSAFYNSGFPGAAVAPSPGLAGVALTSYAGQIPFTNPGAGTSYLAALEVNSTTVGQFHIYDRLWHNSGLAVATLTAQTINSAAWPARDRSGATAGDGVRIGIEVSTATTNAGAITNTTMSYTNSAGVAGKTATMSSFPATAVAGTFVPFELAAGDVGVQSIQTVTLGTSYAGGAIHLVAYRAITLIPICVAGVAVAKDFAQLGMPQLFNNTVLFPLWRPAAVGSVTLSGIMTFAQG